VVQPLAYVARPSTIQHNALLERRWEGIGMKPLFTVHAGEFLVGCEIERRFPHLNLWIPAKDTGVDLLVSDDEIKKTVSLQVKFSRDDLTTHMKDEVFHTELRASGWWTPTRQQIEKSSAQFWVFVLAGFVNRTTDFIIIAPGELLKRLDQIHQKGADKLQCYFCVTKKDRCWETRGLKRSDVLSVAGATFNDVTRDFTPYLNNWKPVEALGD
jgi:hypothetical protein